MTTAATAAKKTITIIGATGGTGICLVRQALDAGHKVKVLVRNEAKLSEFASNENLTIGKGDVTKTHVSWHVKDARCYVPSPVVVDSYLLVADDRGTAGCFDTKTGEQLWKGRLGRHFSASLLSAGGLVYFIADDGETKVVQPGPELNIVADNPLGEWTYASPALSDGQLFIRGEKHLFCIAEK